MFNDFTKAKYHIEIAYFITKWYAQGKIQSTEIIFDAEHGVGFCIGNIMKYAQRYGKKNGFDDRDLLKIIHYAIILLGQKIKEEDEFREYQAQLQLHSD